MSLGGAVALLAACSPETADAVWAWLDGPGFAWFVAFLAVVLLLTSAVPVLARLAAWYEGPRPDLAGELRREIDEAERERDTRYRDGWPVGDTEASA